MTVEHIKATIRGINTIQGKGQGSSVKSIIMHREVAVGASTGSTYTFGRFPSNIRILPTISIFFTSIITSDTSDNISLGTSGDQNLGDDLDSLGIYKGDSEPSVSAALSDTIPVRSNAINGGKMLWELHNPGTLTKDPKAFFEVKATLLAAMEIGGTMSCEIYYIID